MITNEICNEIFAQHDKCVSFKSTLGKKGIYEQSRLNNRFYHGDQWYGAKVGADRPLVRYNLIKRIGEYKAAAVSSGENKVDFSLQNEPLLSNALCEWYNAAAANMRLDKLYKEVLKNAYISGTGVLYTYWDTSMPSGYFADKTMRIPIMGDIVSEVLRIENVDFADPFERDIQKQRYVMILQKLPIQRVANEAEKFGADEDIVRSIKPEDDTGHITVITKFYKRAGKVFAIRVCKNAVVRKEWCLGISRYPLSVMQWENENGGIYGSSEITSLIPNQIAINRMITAQVWAIMMMGMPIMLVNGDLIDCPVTNEPGQILSFCGSPEDFSGAIKYVSPPDFSGGFNENITALVNNTLNMSGVSSAVLGETDLNNASLMDKIQNNSRISLDAVVTRYTAFVEDTAAVFAEFFLNFYSGRPVCNGLNYSPDKYKVTSLRARIISDSIDAADNERILNVLDKLLDIGAITPVQYLERLPGGIVTDNARLIRELQKKEALHDS